LAEVYDQTVIAYFNYKAFLACDDYSKDDISLLLLLPIHAYFNNRER
jgi:hypothetical protein